MSHIVEDLTKKVAEDLAAAREKLLLDCINKRLGTDWTIEDLLSNYNVKLKALATRMRIVHLPNKDQVYQLDGKDLLLIREDPLTVTDDRTNVNVSFQYMELEP